MLYVVTVRKCGSPYGEDATHHAVATLWDLRTQLKRTDGATPSEVSRICRERAGAIGPLADGTVIGVQQISEADVLDELDRITIERMGRGDISERSQQKIMLTARSAQDPLAVYRTLAEQREALRQLLAEREERAVFDLSPQLTGLEGWRVEVVDTEGAEPRQFTVFTSEGWAPRHWEITTHAVLDKPARRDYYSVREIRKVL